MSVAIEELAPSRTDEPYRLLFEAAPDALLVAEVDGAFVDVNRAARELLGYDRDELLGLSLADLAVEPELVVGQTARLLADGRWQGELDLRRKDGSCVPVEAVVTVCPIDGRPAYVASVRDVGARREVEQHQREFISLVGHELRNPIASLKGYAQLMQRRGAYSEEAVRTIVRQSNRLNRLVGDLLDASRLEAGRLELRRVEMDMVARARAAVAAMQELSAEHEVRLVAPDEPVVGWWDRDRVEQILDNLIGNAIKYSPDGGEIVVTVEERGEEVLVSVADRGMGIEPEALPHLFDRLYRAQSARNSPAKGLGLGLYVCKGLVEAMDGRIRVESEPGQGSTFSFTLPRTDAVGHV